MKLHSLACGVLVGVYSGAGFSANPIDANVIHGTVDFANPSAQVLEITNTPSAIINWQQFGIDQNELVRFIQQNADSAVLNRITGQNPSEILGSLESNGRVFVINPNGIVFGENATINTAGLIASTLNISDEDFLSGHYQFEGNAQSGAIENSGFLMAGPGGEIILIAPQIRNEGTIQVSGGQLILAAGEKITLSSLDIHGVQFEVQAPGNEVINLGGLIARKGAVGVFADSIRHGGHISADSIGTNAAGEVVLLAQSGIEIEAGGSITANGYSGGDISVQSLNGDTVVRGMIQAMGEGGFFDHLDLDDVRYDRYTSRPYSAAGNGNAGGHISVLGERVGLFGDAYINASGLSGGGEVFIGGAFQGSNELQASQLTQVSSNSVIRADAINDGDGGLVVVWSDDFTQMAGLATARGGSAGGNGGFIEVSGKEILNFFGDVDTTAVNGLPGMVLFDPRNITIAVSVLPPSVAYDGSSNDQFLEDQSGVYAFTAASINSLWDNQPITLQANNNITIEAVTMNSSNGHPLTLQAGNSIFMNSGPVSLDSNGGDITFIANSTVADGVRDADRLIGTAAIVIGDGVQTADLNSGGGAITLEIRDGAGLSNNTAGQIIVQAGATVNSGNGDIFLRADNGVNALAGSSINAGTRSVFVEPYTPGLTIGISGGSGSLGIANGGLDAVTAQNLFIGSNSAGDIEIGGTFGAPASVNVLGLVTGSDIIFNQGAQRGLDADTNGLVLDAASGGIIKLSPGGTDDAFASSLNVTAANGIRLDTHIDTLSFNNTGDAIVRIEDFSTASLVLASGNNNSVNFETVLVETNDNLVISGPLTLNSNNNGNQILAANNITNNSSISNNGTGTLRIISTLNAGATVTNNGNIGSNGVLDISAGINASTFVNTGAASITTGATPGADIILNADDFDLQTGGTIAAGLLSKTVLLPASAADFALGNTPSSIGLIGITEAELNTVSGNLVVGDSVNTNNITIDDPINLLAGLNLHLEGTGTIDVNANLTLGGTLKLVASTGLSNNSTISGTGGLGIDLELLGSGTITNNGSIFNNAPINIIAGVGNDFVQGPAAVMNTVGVAGADIIISADNYDFQAGSSIAVDPNSIALVATPSALGFALGGIDAAGIVGLSQAELNTFSNNLVLGDGINVTTITVDNLIDVGALNLALDATSTIDINAPLSTTSDLKLVAPGGISQTARISANFLEAFSDSSITLNYNAANPGSSNNVNIFAGHLNSAGNLSFVAAAGFEVFGLTTLAGGSASLLSDGNITQAPDLEAAVLVGNLTVETRNNAGASIVLDHGGNATAGATVLRALDAAGSVVSAGNIVFDHTGDLQIGQLGTAANATLTATGNMTQSGSMVAARLDVSANTGIVLTDLNNAFSQVSAINATSGQLALRSNGADLTIVPLGVQNLSTNGADNVAVVNPAGSITVDGLVSADGGSVTLSANTAINSDITINTDIFANTNLTLTAARDILVNGTSIGGAGVFVEARTGDADITAGRNLGLQGGALLDENTIIFAAGDMNLSVANDLFLSGGTGDSTSAGLEATNILSAVPIGGNLAMSAGGGIDATAFIHASNSVVLDITGNMQMLGGTALDSSAVISNISAGENLSVTLNIGGDLSFLAGSADNAAAAIGTDDANITINIDANNVFLTAGDGAGTDPGALAAIGAVGGGNDATVTIRATGNVELLSGTNSAALIGSQLSGGDISIIAGFGGNEGNIEINDGLILSTGNVGLVANMGINEPGNIYLNGGTLQAGSLAASADGQFLMDDGLISVGQNSIINGAFAMSLGNADFGLSSTFQSSYLQAGGSSVLGDTTFNGDVSLANGDLLANNLSLTASDSSFLFDGGTLGVTGLGVFSGSFVMNSGDAVFDQATRFNSTYTQLGGTTSFVDVTFNGNVSVSAGSLSATDLTATASDGSFTLNSGAMLAISNMGLIDANFSIDDGIYDISGDVVHRANFTQNLGSTHLSDGRLAVTGNFDLIDGVVSGTGFIVTATLNNIGGKIAPGSNFGPSPDQPVEIGALVINGDLVMGENAELSFDLAGAENLGGEAGVDYDLLRVNGNVSLNGELHLIVDLENYRASLDDFFAPLRFESVQGEFSNVFGFPEGYGFNMRIGENGLGVITAQAPGQESNVLIPEDELETLLNDFETVVEHVHQARRARRLQRMREQQEQEETEEEEENRKSLICNV